MSVIMIIIFNFCSAKSCNILHKLNSFQNDLAENRTKPQSRISGTISTSQGQTVQVLCPNPSSATCLPGRCSPCCACCWIPSLCKGERIKDLLHRNIAT